MRSGGVRVREKEKDNTVWEGCREWQLAFLIELCYFIVRKYRLLFFVHIDDGLTRPMFEAGISL
jgi:hypothetical protein